MPRNTSHRTCTDTMPFKKPNNKKNKTRKNQKKPVEKSAPKTEADNSDASSVEEIVVAETPVVVEAPLEDEPIMLPSEYEEYMWKNYYLPEREEALQRWKEGQIKMLEDPDYWEDRLDILERYRSRYHKKAGWSAADTKAVDEIDKEIKNIEGILDDLYGVEPEEPKINTILGTGWWKDSLGDDEWISSR